MAPRKEASNYLESLWKRRWQILYVFSIAFLTACSAGGCGATTPDTVAPVPSATGFDTPQILLDTGGQPVSAAILQDYPAVTINQGENLWSKLTPHERQQDQYDYVTSNLDVRKAFGLWARQIPPGTVIHIVPENLFHNQ